MRIQVWERVTWDPGSTVISKTKGILEEEIPCRGSAGAARRGGRTAGHSQALVEGSPGDVHEGARQRRTDLRGGRPGGPGRVRRVQAEVRETGKPWIPKRGADSRELALTSLGAVPSLMTKVPSMYEMERTSPGPGPTWPANRPSGTADRPPGPRIRANRRFPGASRVPESPPGDARFQR